MIRKVYLQQQSRLNQQIKISQHVIILTAIFKVYMGSERHILYAGCSRTSK